jgi:peptide/nickel transport system permease protein
LARSAGGGSLPRYIGQRLLLVIPMIWVILTAVFFLLRVAPGDPISAAVGGRLTPEALEQRREAAGLNRPLIVQYFDYLGDVVRLDFGQATDGTPVTHIIRDNGGATLILTLAAFLVALVIGIPLGLIAGRYRDNAADASIRLFGIFTYAAPVFVTGILFQLIFVTKLGWLPYSSDMATAPTQYVIDQNVTTHIPLLDVALAGEWEAFREVLWHLLLPAVTLGLLICGVFIRLVRVNMLQTLQGDYVEAARARGIKEGRVVRKHALRNAMVPVVTIIGLQFALLMSGAVLTEATFNWPGLGFQLLDAIQNRDYIAVQGITVFFAIVVIIVSVLIDIVTALIDPRVRY